MILFILLLIGFAQVLISFGPDSTIHFALAEAATIAAVAAPMVIGAMMPKPEKPKYNAPSQPNTYPEYQRQLMESGFNPNSELYRIAGEQAQAKMNRQLARRGLQNSGMGLAALSQQQSDLANKFLENETDRRARVYQAAMAPDLQMYGMNLNAANSAYQADLNRYQDEMSQQKDFLGGIGKMGGSMGSYFASNSGG